MLAKRKTLAIVGTSGPDADILEPVVKLKTEQALRQGYLIVTGGATGVDTVVIETLLEKDPHLENLKVLLPHAFEHSYQWKPEYGKLTPELKHTLAKSKSTIAKVIKTNKPALIDRVADQITDHAHSSKFRNQQLAKMADEVWAFFARPSGGTLFTVKTAQKLSKKIKCFDKQGKEVDLAVIESQLSQK